MFAKIKFPCKDNKTNIIASMMTYQPISFLKKFKVLKCLSNTVEVTFTACHNIKETLKQVAINASQQGRIGLLAHMKLLLSSLFAKAFSFDKLCELYKLHMSKAEHFCKDLSWYVLATYAGG